MTAILVGMATLVLLSGATFLAMVARVRAASLPYTLALADGSVAEHAHRKDWFAAARAELERLGFAPVAEFTLPDLRGNVVNAALHQAHPPTYAVLTEVSLRGPGGEQQAHAVTLLSTLEDGRVVQTTGRAAPSLVLAADVMLEQALPDARPTRLFVSHLERLQALTKGGGAVAERSPQEFKARYAEIYSRLQQAEVARRLRTPPDGSGRVRLTWRGAARLVVRGLLHRARA